MSAPPSGSDVPDLMEVARQLAQSIARAESTPFDPQRRLLIFQVAGTRLALPLSGIREVVEVPELLSKVPRAPAALLGIMNLRGRVVAVVDLAQTLPASMLGGGSTSPSPITSPAQGEAARILLVERRRREVGLLVHLIEGISESSEVGGTVSVLDPDQVQSAIEALVA